MPLLECSGAGAEPFLSVDLPTVAGKILAVPTVKKQGTFGLCGLGLAGILEIQEEYVVDRLR